MTSTAAIVFVSYQIVHLKQQNHSKVGTDKPELKIKSVLCTKNRQAHNVLKLAAVVRYDDNAINMIASSR